MKISVIKHSARWLCTTGLMTLVAAGFSMQVAAQTCSGAIALSTDLASAPLFYDELPAQVRVTVRPSEGDGSDPLTVSQMRYALACTNNLSEVPCAWGNDEAPDGSPPIGFVGNVDGTCGATEGVAEAGDPGVIDFNFDPIIVGDGCTINFDIEVLDIGSDDSPFSLTAAAEHDGECMDEQLAGSAAGTLLIRVVDPAITVTKDGPDAVKVGDEACYDIAYEDVGATPVGNCTGFDDVLGDLGAFESGVSKQFCRQITADDDNPLVNTATITCDVLNATGTLVLSENGISESDTHSVGQIEPEITVTKTGPDTAKVGDIITYTIGFENTGTGDLENCTGEDTVLGSLGEFEAGVTREFTHTVTAQDPNPLYNEATITCDVVGFENQASDFDDHTVDLINPAFELSKVCQPDPVIPGDEIEWIITVTNTGDVDLECSVHDEVAEIDGESVSVGAGGSETVAASRLVTEDDYPVISNTASAYCSVAGFDNILKDKATADCEVEIPGEEICRTPGFWGTHAGTEHRRSTNLTQLVIDAGGPLSICGQTIDNTDVGNVNSAVEAMCVRIEGEQQRQLARQLTAMALNCIVSGGGADCSGTSVEGLFADANAACIADGELGSWIDQVDDFNNGVDSDCNERELDESTDIFDGVSPFPGPAGSPRACSSANGNGIKVVPAF